MDNYDREMATINMVNRLNARNAAQAADIREHAVRNDIAVNLMMRGIDDIPTILLVLGYEDAADSLVMAKIDPDDIRDIVGQSYMDWEKFVALKMLNAQKPAPAVYDDSTEDDLPFPADESEVAADEA